MTVLWITDSPPTHPLNPLPRVDPAPDTNGEVDVFGDGMTEKRADDHSLRKCRNGVVHGRQIVYNEMLSSVRLYVRKWVSQSGSIVGFTSVSLYQPFCPV